MEGFGDENASVVSPVARWEHDAWMMHRFYLDKASPHAVYRWIGTLVIVAVYCSRLYYVRGFYIIVYGLGVYIVNLLSGFLSLLVDPEHEHADGPLLSTSCSDEFKPHIRRLPEFKFWYSFTRAFIMAFAMTFFPVFDVPVVWSILLCSWTLLFVVTMGCEIRYLIRYKCTLFNIGKQVSFKNTVVRNHLQVPVFPAWPESLVGSWGHEDIQRTWLPSRASWKLVQLDTKFKFLQSSRAAFDLGAASGGWMQVEVQRVALGDLVKKIMGVRAFDLVLHDGSPNIGGAWAQEAMTQNSLVIDAVRLATQFLAPKGTFVTKVFRSQDYSSVIYVLIRFDEQMEDIPDQANERFVTKREGSTKQRKCAVQSKRMLNNFWRVMVTVILFFQIKKYVIMKLRGLYAK
ncbi:hypothetical protein POTOM_017703 [Populus tomentosa]|uniref:Ribosomal RNA methyltransferase FtsJ domain-containing protein n=1 Tax=Populus tomentosa TaxID=118781 RepID=A0A8X7ZV79_POPTO|nr:hypothetical protein POTOM_017703 [Populus tomentosa]